MNYQTVLTHGFSRVVISVLQHALQQGKRFNVIVTEAKPGEIGFQTSQILQDANIPVTLILDSAVAFVMDKVDLILVGAEGIVENGGIINKVKFINEKVLIYYYEGGNISNIYYCTCSF